MLSLLKILPEKWEQAKGYLRLDLEAIESALNTRWSATFGPSNLLNPDTIQGYVTTQTRYIANTGTDPAYWPMWDQVDLTNGVKERLPFSSFVAALAPSVLVGRGSTSAGDYEQIALGAGLKMSGTTLDVDLTRLQGSMPIPDEPYREDPWPASISTPPYVHSPSPFMVGGVRTIYVPNQTQFTGSIFYGTGGTSLSLASTGSEGLQNTAVGLLALNAVTTGYNNTAVGYNCLAGTTSGFWNTAIGVRALQLNVTGDYNMAVGQEALRQNDSGNQNVAIGVTALAANIVGEDNVGIGFEALKASTGYYNVAIGSRSLLTNTTASFNVAVGLQAQHSKSTGDANTAIGAYSMRDQATGANNVSIGYRAGYGVASNAYGNCTLIGARAGEGLTTGSNNLLFGFQAGDNLTSGANNIIIGYNIDAPAATSANVMSLGNLLFANGLDGAGTTISAGNIAIGTTAFPSTGTRGLIFGDGTALATMGSNTAGLYADDVGGTVEMFGISEAGNVSQLTGLNICKTADESVTNSTAHQADDELTVNLAASSRYQFEIFGFWTTAGVTAGISVQLDGTVGVGSIKADIGIMDYTTNAYSAYARVVAFNSAVGAGLTGDNSFMIKGVIETTTAGTMLLEWAQNGADAVNATILQENSYFTLRKLNA